MQGTDCISSIAKSAGHFWEKIWNYGPNAELRAARQDPNVLLREDRVAIPEIKPKHEPGETEMRHRFVRRGEPAVLRMRILVEDEPVVNAAYRLAIDGKSQDGTTDADGRVQAHIPGNARSGRLIVDAPDQQLAFPLTLGGIDPVTEPSGVQGRLSNLGYQCGRLDGKIGRRAGRRSGSFSSSTGIRIPTARWTSRRGRC